MSTGHQSKKNRYVDWLLIARIMAAQVLVLLALAGATVWYVNWSSDVAYREFLSANQPALASATSRPAAPPSLQSESSVQTVKDKAVCTKKSDEKT